MIGYNEVRSQSALAILDYVLGEFGASKTNAIGLNHLRNTVGSDIDAMSDSLDHVDTIDHGSNHVWAVTSFMTELIPELVPDLKAALVDRYGEYWEIVVALTGLLHDIGYTEVATHPAANLRMIFYSQEHYSLGAQRFRQVYTLMIKRAFPLIPDDYLDDIERAIQCHGAKFSDTEPLNGEDNPLLLLILLADKAHRNFSRLHPLHRSEIFRTGLEMMEASLASKNEVMEQLFSDLERLERDEIPHALSECDGVLHEGVLLGLGYLSSQLELLPWNRNDELCNMSTMNFVSRYLSGVEDEAQNKILGLFHQRFLILHNISVMKWNFGSMFEVLNYIGTNLMPHLLPIALKFFLSSPHFRSVLGDINRFKAVSQVSFRSENGHIELNVSTIDEAGKEVAERIARGLRHVYFNGKLIRVYGNEIQI